MPGSNNRVVAMIAGQGKATILDLSNKNKIVAQAGDRFHALPMFEVKASDEALFANLNWIKENEKAVNIFVDALHSVWTDMAKDPTIIRRETNADGPIGQLPAEVLAELDGFYKDAVEGGLYDPNGGGREAAKADMEWYTGGRPAGRRSGHAEHRGLLVLRTARRGDEVIQHGPLTAGRTTGRQFFLSLQPDNSDGIDETPLAASQAPVGSDRVRSLGNRRPHSSQLCLPDLHRLHGGAWPHDIRRLALRGLCRNAPATCWSASLSRPLPESAWGCGSA